MQRKQKLSGALTRRKVLKYGLYGGLAMGLAPNLWIGGCGKRQQGKKPNIILIVIDTLRADHVGCYGYHRNTTPNIDDLAQEGILFKNAISSAPWTLPSIANILTSQYPCVLGMYDRPVVINPYFPLLSELLKKNNYTTHGVISHALLSSCLGFSKGYDSYDEEYSGHEGLSSPRVTNKAIRFLRKSHKKPFFLFTHYFDPHYNYFLHQRYNYYPSYRGSLRSGQPILELWRIRHSMSQDDIRYLVSLYDSEIAFTDEYIKKLLDELKKQGLYDDSIIIATSDHGEEFMERGWIGHCITLHRELLRVPLIMKFPGCKARVVDSPTGLIDIMPTILRYLGLEVPDILEGRAFDVSSASSIISRPIFSETFNPQRHRLEHVEAIAFRSIVLDDQKLIYDEKKDSEQIYDVDKDPHEQNNLSGQHSEQNRRLKALLSEWIKYVKKKQKPSPTQRESELFTPEQRKQLKSLGYL